MSKVKCRLSLVACHLSLVACHLSLVACRLLIRKKKRFNDLTIKRPNKKNT